MNWVKKFVELERKLEFLAPGQVVSTLKIGDWISRPISSFSPLSTLRITQHHGVVSDFKKDGTPIVTQLNVSYFPHFCIGIRHTNLRSFLGCSKSFRLYAAPVGTPRTREEIKRRIDALEKSGKYSDTYSLEFRNCEHYATELLTGKAVSYQINLLLQIKTGKEDASSYPKFVRTRFTRLKETGR